MIMIHSQAVSTTGEWCETLMTYIRNNDVSLAEASEKIISTYESELLPCESLGEIFDVIGELLILQIWPQRPRCFVF